MNYTGKTVYTVNAQTKLVDVWTCEGEFKGEYQGEKEKLCILVQGRKQCILPKRCVFLDSSKAIAVAKSSD